jgi:hypothetical protein
MESRRRHWRVVTSKKERFRGVINLVPWNHKDDQDNFPRAKELMREFRHTTLCFRKADALVRYATDSTARHITPE